MILRKAAVWLGIGAPRPPATPTDIEAREALHDRVAEVLHAAGCGCAAATPADLRDHLVQQPRYPDLADAVMELFVAVETCNPWVRDGFVVFHFRGKP